MSSKTLGVSPLKISSEVVFDPKYGFTTRELYSGTPTTINTLNATLILLGVRTTVTTQAGRTFLTAYFGVQDSSGVTPETPNDYYELETEYVQESVWHNDKVESAARVVAAANGGAETTSGVLARWRRIIEAGMKGMVLSDDSNNQFNKITEGPVEPSSLAPDLEPFGLDLYKDFVRDADTYETTRQVLTRNRTVSVAYSAQTVAQTRPIIYTTAQLIAVFGIPAAVAARLPADPTDVPTNALWAWKQRRNTSRYEWSGRVAEVMSWTFAAWSVLTHQLYGSSA